MGCFFPRYHLHTTYGYHYVMSARKKICSNTSTYILAIDKDFNKVVGRIVANFFGTIYTIQDNNIDMGVVWYEPNSIKKSPMRMRVGIDNRRKGTLKSVKYFQKEYRNKEPVLDKNGGNYHLNF